MTAEEKNKVLEAALAEANAKIEDLESKKTSNVVVAKFPTFKSGNNEYQFNYAHFDIEDKKHTAEEVKDDKELCAEIVKNYTGLVTKLK